ncbi:response regulator [uncultured Jannaschia sp.]|uniref:response regulator transcription factor n=1 Tax=uncultured Jannaschia sp. TaxID=293347 RepID=UPI0026301ED1|nr:response regulator [uncultured Jannaschia sp.]
MAAEKVGLPETEKFTVAVVEDDPAVSQALDSLLRSVGYDVRTYGAPREILADPHLKLVDCLILDVRMPMSSGFDLQAELARAEVRVPIIFMTGYGDVPMSVRAMKAGAVDFLQKPFRDQDMLDAVASAIRGDRDRREASRMLSDHAALFASLTQREREVMALATEGMMNKQIAYELGLSEITVKIHRGKVMRKMGAKTFADLVRLASDLKLGNSRP